MRSVITYLCSTSRFCNHSIAQKFSFCNRKLKKSELFDLAVPPRRIFGKNAPMLLPHFKAKKAGTAKAAVPAFCEVLFPLVHVLHGGDFILDINITLRKADFPFILRSLFCFRFTQFFIGLRTDCANWRKIGVRLVYRRFRCP